MSFPFTVTRTWLKGGVGAEGDDAPAGNAVLAAKIVPAGKSGEDALAPLTVAGPDTPGEDELVLPPPLPHAARAAEIVMARSRYVTFRNVRSGVLMALSSSFDVPSFSPSPRRG